MANGTGSATGAGRPVVQRRRPRPSAQTNAPARTPNVAAPDTTTDVWTAPKRSRRERGDARAQMRKLVMSSGLAEAVNRTVSNAGSDYSHNRLYSEGDDARKIDWKATARSDKLHTKVFTEDPSPIVMMVIPSKVWQKNTIHERERRRHLEQVASLMAFSSEHHKTPFGVMVYSDKTDLFAVAPGDPGSSDSVLDRLAALDSGAGKDEPSGEDALVGAELGQLRGRKAIIMYCTDRPDDPVPDEVRALSKDHELMRVSISPDRISSSQPAMLQVHGYALSEGGEGVTNRKTLGGSYDALIAQRLLDRQPVDTDEVETIALNVEHTFASQLSFFFGNRR